MKLHETSCVESVRFYVDIHGTGVELGSTGSWKSKYSQTSLTVMALLKIIYYSDKVALGIKHHRKKCRLPLLTSPKNSSCSSFIFRFLLLYFELLMQKKYVGRNFRFFSDFIHTCSRSVNKKSVLILNFNSQATGIFRRRLILAAPMLLTRQILFTY